jgi:hypothetical protein
MEGSGDQNLATGEIATDSVAEEDPEVERRSEPLHCGSRATSAQAPGAKPPARKKVRICNDERGRPRT